MAMSPVPLEPDDGVPRATFDGPSPSSTNPRPSTKLSRGGEVVNLMTTCSIRWTGLCST